MKLKQHIFFSQTGNDRTYADTKTIMKQHLKYGSNRVLTKKAICYIDLVFIDKIIDKEKIDIWSNTYKKSQINAWRKTIDLNLNNKINLFIEHDLVYLRRDINF